MITQDEVSREIIFQAAEEAGLVRTHSCCNVELKLCETDEWRGNLEGFANAIIRLLKEAGVNKHK